MLIKITTIITTIIFLLPQNGLCLRPVATRIYAEIKLPITKEVVIKCCETGKPIPWKKHSLTPEFARWVLEIIAENSLIYNRSPEDVEIIDIIRPIAILNNRQLSSLLEHPDLQEKDKLLNEKRALENLKLLAGYDLVENPIIPPLTEKIVRDCCENGKPIPWKKHRLTPEFARWLLEIAAKNISYDKKPEDVTTDDFNRRIKALNNRVILGILYHSDLKRRDSLFISFADALKNLKLLAGYKLEGAKPIIIYKEPVDDIISEEAELDSIAYNQIEQLITQMRNGNLIAKERLKKLFNPYFKNILDSLKYKIYRNNQIHDKKWAENELSQQLCIKYEALIKGLKTEKLKKGYFASQIKKFIKTSLRRQYYKFYNKLQKQGFKEPLVLNCTMPNGKAGKRFDKGKEIIDSISGKQPMPADILGAVDIIQKLISVMEEKNVSAKDISLFFDFHLSGLTQRELGFKYDISRYGPYVIVMKKILITRHILKQDIYHEFLKEVASIKKHIDYISIIEQHPAIREFRKNLRGLAYDENGIKAGTCLDTSIIARAFASSA